MRWGWSWWAQWWRPGPPWRGWRLCWARRRPRRWSRSGRRECRSGWGSSPSTSRTGSHTRGGSNYLSTQSQLESYHSGRHFYLVRKGNGWNMFPGAVTRLQASNIKCDKIPRQTHDYTVTDTQRLRWDCENIPLTKPSLTSHLWINWPRWFSVCVRGPWTEGGWRPPTPGRCWVRHSTCTWCLPSCSRLKEILAWLKWISEMRKTRPIWKRAF